MVCCECCMAEVIFDKVKQKIVFGVQVIVLLLVYTAGGNHDPAARLRTLPHLSAR